jgi:hypothetical protein
VCEKDVKTMVKNVKIYQFHNQFHKNKKINENFKRENLYLASL